MDTPLHRWRGKVALVTGASSGIGRAIALDLGALPMRVAITGRRADELEAVAAEIRSRGGEALALPGDQTELAHNARVFAAIRARWGSVDLLVNNAGVRGGASLLTANLEEIQQGLNLNVLAAIACMREAVADLRGKRDAAIIAISSMVGHRVMAGVPPLYAATKHALRVITDGLRTELSGSDPQIKVALISPGLVDTPWHLLPNGVLREKGAYPHGTLKSEDIVAAVHYILSVPPHVQISDILLRPTGQPL